MGKQDQGRNWEGMVAERNENWVEIKQRRKEHLKEAAEKPIAAIGEPGKTYESQESKTESKVEGQTDQLVTHSGGEDSFLLIT